MQCQISFASRAVCDWNYLENVGGHFPCLFHGLDVKITFKITVACTVGAIPKTLGKVAISSPLLGDDTGCSKATLDDVYSALGIGLNILFFSIFSGGDDLHISSSRSNAARSSSRPLMFFGRICLIIGGTGLDRMY